MKQGLAINIHAGRKIFRKHFGPGLNNSSQLWAELPGNTCERFSSKPVGLFLDGFEVLMKADREATVFFDQATLIRT